MRRSWKITKIIIIIKKFSISLTLLVFCELLLLLSINPRMGVILLLLRSIDPRNRSANGVCTADSADERTAVTDGHQSAINQSVFSPLKKEFTIDPRLR